MAAGGLCVFIEHLEGQSAGCDSTRITSKVNCAQDDLKATGVSATCQEMHRQCKPAQGYFLGLWISASTTFST